MIVAEVGFLKRTGSDHLLHTKFKLRDDRDAKGREGRVVLIFSLLEKDGGHIFTLGMVLAATHVFQTGEHIGVTTLDKNGSQYAVFTVQVSELVYTVRGERLAGTHLKDFSKGLIVGDAVQASVEGNSVVLVLPNGKNLKTSILTANAQPRRSSDLARRILASLFSLTNS